jgi:hypothetical protein
MRSRPNSSDFEPGLEKNQKISKEIVGKSETFEMNVEFLQKSKNRRKIGEFLGKIKNIKENQEKFQNCPI